MLRAKVQDEMKTAMRNRDAVRLETVRFLWSEIRYAEIDAKKELDDNEVHQIVKREIKKRSEAIEQMKGAGRVEMASDEQAKVVVLEEFMMEELGEEEVGAMVDQVLAEGLADFGSVMKKVLGMANGKADGKLVSQVVKGKLEK